MQMLDVLKRLTELDAGNPNVKKPVLQTMPVTSVAEGANQELPQLPALEDMDTLKALSGVKPIAECGPMGIMGGGMGQPTPASFSLNASASTGDEVASMLTQIMNLAGVVKGEPEGGDVLTAQPGGDDIDDGGDSIAKAAAHGPEGHQGGGEIMRAMMDKINDPSPEDEDPMALAAPIGGDEIASGGEMGGEFSGSDSPVADMADEVRDMADTLAVKNDEEDQKQEESWDNQPGSPFNVGTADTNAHAYQPNQGSAAGRGFGANPRGRTAEAIEQELFREYQSFIAEGKDEFAKGKNFEKISKAAGGGEKGDRIAGAARAAKIKKAGGKVKYAK